MIFIATFSTVKIFTSQKNRKKTGSVKERKKEIEKEREAIEWNFEW